MTVSSDHTVPVEAIVIASGGLDSTTLIYHLLACGSRVRLLSFDYGQRHRRELDAARGIAASLRIPFQLVDLRTVGALLSGCALTDLDVDVPDGYYTDKSMRLTVVPNRNSLMLDVAVAVAATLGCDAVAFGAHGGDHLVYPDCRPEFLEAFTASAKLANQGFLPDDFCVVAPFLRWSKADVVRLGATYHVPFELTWSCYKGGAMQCGTCGTCTERREAFRNSQIPDPTTYLVA